MATIQVTYHRSKEWCKAEAIRLGESVLNEEQSEFNSKFLSDECRQAIIEIVGDGKYPSYIGSIYYWRDGDLSFSYQSWGEEKIKIDSHNPDNQEISEAILDAIYRAQATKRKLAEKTSIESQIAGLQSRLAELK